MLRNGNSCSWLIAVWLRQHLRAEAKCGDFDFFNCFGTDKFFSLLPRPVAASIASLATDVSDDVLQRLAKMVAAEIKAETRKTRVLLRDVGSQTIKEISLAPRGDAAELPLVNSSTQTLSTGGIKSDNLFVDND